MIRQFLCVLVASTVLAACNSAAPEGKKESWEKVYKNAYTHHDYFTAIVALNQLILKDSANEQHYDSLATYYLKKVQNYNAGRIMVDKGLAINPNNFQLIEYKSLLMLAEGKFADARALLQKAYDLSKKNKFRYMIATTYANENNITEFEKIIDELLNSNMPSEKVEAMVDNTNTQIVELKAMCYLGKVKISKDPSTMMRYLDSALKIQPDYQEAYYIMDELKKKGGR